MWQYREDPEINRLVDAYIFKHYHHLLQISGLYPKMEGRNRIFSVLQLITYVITLTYHLVILIKSTITIYGFNMAIFSQNIHFILLMLISLIVLLSILWMNYNMFLIHWLLSYDFYNYQEPAVIEEELLRSNMKTERRRLNLSPLGVVLAAGVVLIVSPIVDFKVGSFDFNGAAPMFDYHFPYPYGKYPYYVEDGFSYYFAVLGQLAVGFVMTVVIGGGGFTLINISENAILQLQILNNSLDNIESRIEDMYSKHFGKINRHGMNSLRYDSRYAYCTLNA